MAFVWKCAETDARTGGKPQEPFFFILGQLWGPLGCTRSPKLKLGGRKQPLKCAQRFVQPQFYFLASSTQPLASSL